MMDEMQSEIDKQNEQLREKENEIQEKDRLLQAALKKIAELERKGA